MELNLCILIMELNLLRLKYERLASKSLIEILNLWEIDWMVNQRLMFFALLQQIWYDVYSLPIFFSVEIIPN